MHIKVIFSILIVALVVTGCGDKLSYSTFKSQFEKAYYEVASYVDIQHAYDSVKRLQLDKNIKNIEEMKDLLNSFRGNIPSSKKISFEQLQEQYQGIAFLQETYKRWDSLTTDEKVRFNTELWRAYHLYQENKKAK